MNADRGKEAAGPSSSKLEVPRFSSYQPIASSSRADQHGDHSKDSEDRRSRKRRRHHKDSEDAEKRSRQVESSRRSQDQPKSTRHRRNSHKSARHKSTEKSNAVQTSHHEGETPPPTFDRNLFFTDTEGDKDALLYGQDTSKVPRAHRASRSQPAIGAASPSKHASQPPALPIAPASVPAPATSSASRSNNSKPLYPAEEFISLDSHGSEHLVPLPRPYKDRDDLPDQFGSDHPSQTSILPLLSQKPRERPTGLQDLPVELLHNILVLSRSSDFPLTCRFLRQASSNASITDKVDYVLGRWVNTFMVQITSNPCRDKHKACRHYVNRLAAIWRETDPVWYDFMNAMLGTLPPCMADTIRTSNLDVITFVAELRICKAVVLERAIAAAKASRIPRAFVVATPLIPKRLFRHIEYFDYADTTQSHLTAHVIDPPKHHDDDKSAFDERSESRTRGAVRQEERFPGWLSTLLQSLACVPSRKDSNDDVKSRVGPIPSVEDLRMILVLLYQYGADASSHQGYPLAMAVHRKAYSLIHLLLLFGADPECKEGLAGQIAIRNGSLDILHLLVIGPCLDADVITHLPIASGAPLQPGSRTFQLDQTHLRLAIQCRQWEMVDYIWHDRQVSPDIACLRLIEKLRQ